ncbi:transport permease protein [Sphaerisporangium krabiense]|uniref:Transport permease protein n=1 Tax=Sphaerisporangium krabiense TaxID=763782 RepID=A0A7W8Z9A1_9ACTN|nr:ABC transporter permease [Sphaerisporangium krabiense]MBB5629836.1 ABC-2 type transport system permease protein [Sphaerisporangium krabiense]GII63936.1 transport permease protein [Sphaerisporangium krabiense]
MTRQFVRDVATVFVREVAPVLRAPVLLFLSMVQPLLLLFLFGPMLAGTGGFGGGAPWQWFVPGILIMMCLTGPMMAGCSMLIDLMGGSMERMLVTPLNRTAMLVGRVLKEFVILLVQAVLIIGLALPLGFRPSPAGVLAGLALLIVFGTGLGALSFVLAIASRPDGNLFWGVTQMLLFPLMLLSGVLLPTDYGPGWLRTAAAFNPVSYIVEAERALFAGRPADLAVLYGVISACAVGAAGLAFGTRAVRRGI